MVKWCLRGFEVSDKCREQRHFSRLVHDNTVIGNISEIVVTVGYSSLLIKKFGNHLVALPNSVHDICPKPQSHADTT